MNFFVCTEKSKLIHKKAKKQQKGTLELLKKMHYGDILKPLDIVFEQYQ